MKTVHGAALVVAVAGSLAVVAGGAGAPAAAPITLVETDAPIYEFAQDGGRIAWSARVPGGPPFAAHAAVYVRAAAGGRVARLTPQPELGNIYDFALAGGRAVWSAGYDTMSTWTIVGTAAIDDRRTRRPAGGQFRLKACDGQWVSTVVGDGRRLFYSVLESEEGEDYECVDGVGHVARVVGGRGQKLPGVAGARLLALAGATLALVRGWGEREVEVRDADTGRLETSLRLGGAPRAIALGGDYVAAIVRRGNSPRLEVRDLATGELRGAVPLRGRLGHALSAAGDSVVYSTGLAIHVLDVTTVRSTRVALAAAPPIGLSIEGRRIAWAENARGRAWIKSLTLP